ncbi:Alpha/beta hydrolase family-domain-containing protein [Dactylonectria macrodidyma]|uniref:Alpha/beta hydrolase family-domain-containing protein n=1 Tax=Dactylonectria macrodidyma TaxID=307937 RepID=A0A9P9EMY4_9HYPO|nr:Alpha/beta hydrolase family-domain-containing protein [Dactylonectria macrodidyma]
MFLRPLRRLQPPCSIFGVPAVFPIAFSSSFLIPTSRKMSSFFREVEHTITGHHSREYVTATKHGDEDVPKLAVKQYIPLDNPNPQPGDVTIVAAHANGFPKELYEPLWDEFYKRMTKHGVGVRCIWIADMWNQGQSGVLNEEILANDPSWSDHARDLMSLINQKQGEMPHPLIGIGHSMGGTQLTLLSIWHPRLLRSLVLLDPVIQIPNGSISPAILSTPRRDVWTSREAAAERFKKSKFYQAWDPRVLDQWIKHGLRQTPTELHPADTDSNDHSVTLTTSKHQELFTFLRPMYRNYPADTLRDKDPATESEHPGYKFYRPEPAYVFNRLQELRPSVLYVFGAKSELSTPERRNEKMKTTGVGVGGSGGVSAGRVKEVLLDCGHLVAMEKVAETADAITEFVTTEMQQWKREKQELAQYWGNRSRQEQITIDEKWSKEVTPEALRGKKSLL